MQVDESKVKALESIFGGQDITASVIRTVLSSSDNKFDDAVDSLLNMTTSSEESSAPRRTPQEEELDEDALLDRREREKIKTLENMFGSDLSNSVICTVLESNKGELVDTVDTLLNMTSKEINPNYEADNRKGVDRESERLKQEQDMKNYEEFKRLQIRLQEEEARAMKEQQRKLEEEAQKKKNEDEQRRKDMLKEQDRIVREYELASKKKQEEEKKKQEEEKKKQEEEKRKLEEEKKKQEEAKRKQEEAKKLVAKKHEEEKKLAAKKKQEEEKLKKLQEAKQVEEARLLLERMEAEKLHKLQAEEASKKEQARLQQEWEDRLKKLKEEEESLRRAEVVRKQEEDKRREALIKQEESLRKKALEEEERIARLGEEEKRILKQRKQQLLAEEARLAEQRKVEDEIREKRRQEELKIEAARRREAEEQVYKQKIEAERQAHLHKLAAEQRAEELRLQLEEQRLALQREKAALEAAVRAQELKAREEELRVREEAELKRLAILAQKEMEEEAKRQEELRRIAAQELEEQRRQEEQERQERERLQREEEEAKRLEAELKALALAARAEKEAHQLAYEQMAASAVFIPPKAKPSEEGITTITAFVAGDTVTCTWDLPEGNATPTNWLGLYPVRSLVNTKKYVQFAYTNSTSTGQHVFRGVTPGYYEVRFFATRGYEHAARSAPVCVGPTATVMPQVQGEHVLVYYTLSPLSSTPTREWLGIYEKGQRRNKLYLSTAYGNAEGQVMMKAPRTPGMYEVRLFATGAVYNDQAKADFVIEDNDCVNVEPSSVMAGANATISWILRTVEPSTGDWVGLYRADETNNSNYLSCTYTNGSSVGTATIQSPKEAGVYEFRLFAKAKGKYTTFRTSSPLTIV